MRKQRSDRGIPKYSDAAFIARHSKTNATGCWIWTGSLNSWGYGRVGANRSERSAHRLSFSTFRESIPAGMKVLHKCDTPACVNPEHLFLGTDADNMQDMQTKGRGSGNAGKRGEANVRAKLSAEVVEEIRSTPIVRGVITALARQHGVSRRAINFALRGETWSR